MVFFGICPAHAQTLDKFTDVARSWTDNEITNSSFLDMLKIFFDNGVLVRYPIPQNTFFLPQKGDSLSVVINGKIEEYGKSGSVVLNVIQPDSSMINSSALVLPTGTYETTLVFDNTAMLGAYKVNASFEGKKLDTVYFTITKQTRQIPEWFKDTTRWWVEKKMTDKEYFFAIQYLINHRIIIDDVKTIQTPIQESLLVKVSGQQMIRRGTTQEISIQVSSNEIPVNGAQVFIRLEDYGENILKEFKGYTDSSGMYSISWEIDKSINDYTTMLAYIDVTDGKSVSSKLFKFVVYCIPGEQNCKIKG